jgi:hypothetical protein
MAGLIDSKTRVLDGILTSRGRSSLINGGIDVSYISFSDMGATYEDNGDGVAVVPIPVGLESFSTPNDEITVTTDDFGDQNSFNGSEYSIRSNGSVNNSSTSTSIDAPQTFLYSGSLESFDNQRLISTTDAILDDQGLSISPDNLSFSVSDPSPFGNEPSRSSIDDVESLFADRRLGRSINFLYLPPIQRTITTVGNEVLLGNYADVRENPLNEQEIESQMSSLEKSSLNMSRYTGKNEVCMQLFESSSSGLTKLDIIKYGDLSTRGESGRQRTLYFAGKVYEDGYGNPTFVNIFDLVIE